MLPVLTLRHVTKKFEIESRKELLVLKDVNLEILPGEFFIFLGPSGSGKSTLLRIMSRLERAHEGEVVFDKSLTTSDMSFVFQQFALLPWLTVFENIELGLIARHVPEEERREIVFRELAKLGLEKFSSTYPRELSGGMRQRVGLARAFVTKPKIIFLDEPFSEVDSFTAEELRKELLGVWQRTKETVVMVTHNVEEALELADRVAVLASRPAKIEKIVRNTLPRPRNKRSREFYALEDELYRLIRP